MKKIYLLIISVFIPIINSASNDQDTLFIQNGLKQVVSHGKEKYFFDKNDLNIKEVIGRKFKDKKQMDLSYVTGWFWVKLIVKNNSSSENFVLNASDGHVSGFYLYKPTITGYEITPSRQYHPEDGREIYNRLPCFYINIPKRETRTFYVKINSNNEIINFDFIIRNQSNFSEFIQSDYMIIGLYFGALLIIILVNIFYYFSLKDTIFLSYALFVFSNFLFTATLDGFTWLWISSPQFAYYLCFFCFRTWGDSLIFFVMQLVNLKQHNKLLNYFGVAFILYHSIFIAIIGCFDFSKSFMQQLETINWILSMLLVLVVIKKSYNNNRYLFKYYIIAFLTIFCFFLFLIYHTVGNAENYLVFEHGMKAGTLIEIIILSFAVSRRFKLTEDDLRHKKEAEQQLNDQISQLEMNVRKAQMNPHFMFNALTSIEYFIMKHDAQKARDYLEKFSRLMRLTLDNSRSNYISMTDDLDALTFYIELEFMRLSVCEHQYEINIDEAIDPDKTFVPALLIQPFVENAIWHGLQKKESAGHLLIDLRMQGNELRCTIEDDGGGMDQKKIPVKRKSSGMVITKERLILIHGAQHSRYEFRVEDVKNEAGSIIGTKIQFNMPYIKE